MILNLKFFILDDRRKSQSSYSDSNQLFLGNLPHNATEEELREVFVDFGPIVDLRVHSKPSKNGMPGGRAPPNYGFITFETPQGVQNCLAARVSKLHFYVILFARSIIL